MSLTSSAIASPCINVCILDPVTKLCLGCGRTGEEIGGWLSMSPAMRDAIMAALPARLSSSTGAARRAPQTSIHKDTPS